MQDETPAKHTPIALNVELIDLDMITLDPENARKHFDHGIERIKKSLQRYGQRTAIVLQSRDDGLIVRKGNGTVMAARSLGWKHIAAVTIDEPDHFAAGYAIADNRTGEFSIWDHDVLLKQLEALSEEPEGLYGVGYDLDDIEILKTELGEGWPDEEDAEDLNQTTEDRVRGRIIILCELEKRDEVLELIQGALEMHEIEAIIK